MTNPFDQIDARLSRLEAATQEAIQYLKSVQQPAPTLGGIELAQSITGLSKARIYTLVSERLIPHSKRGNRLFFNRAELVAWLEEGKRATTTTR